MFPSTSNLCYIAFTLSIKCCLNTSSHIQTFPKLDWQDCPTSSDRPRCVWADLILTWGRQQCTLFLPLSHRQPRGAWFWYGHLPPCRLCAPSPPLMLLFFRDSWRSSCRPTGHQTSHQAFTVMSPLIYMGHLPVLSRLDWICHALRLQVISTAFSCTERCSVCSVMDCNIGGV